MVVRLSAMVLESILSQTVEEEGELSVLWTFAL